VADPLKARRLVVRALQLFAVMFVPFEQPFLLAFAF
jgi:hypothetical protein